MDVWRVARDSLGRVSLTTDALHQRFTSITLPPHAKLSTKSAERRKNERSNRYSNILPFDHNRIKVKATTPEGGRGEYINASLIQVSIHICAALRICSDMSYQTGVHPR